MTDAEAVAVVEQMRRERLLVPPRLHNSFTARYVTALVLIASLTLGIFVTGIREIEVTSTDAATVNVAGRQRMLSQRIALLAGMYDEALAADRTSEAADLEARLGRDVRDLGRAQTDLLEGNPGRNLPGSPSAAVLALYESGTAADVEAHVADGTAVLAAVDDDARADLVARLQTRAVSGLLADLDRIVAVYQAESESRSGRMLTVERTVLVAMLGLLVLEALLVFRPMSRRIRRETAELHAAAARHEAQAEQHAFGLRLRDAVELADTEADLVQVVGQAVTASRAAGHVDLLLTDGTDPGRLLPVHAQTDHTCSVRDTDGCPALRRGRTMTFADPAGLGSCSHFRRDAAAAGRDDLVSTCVPLTFLGAGLGVLRGVHETEEAADSGVEDLEHVARATGTHLGTLRAFAQTRAAAERDPLTGLLNRRGLDTARAALERSGTHHLVLAIDLDHFKRINDVHGHAAGDGVLADTAQVLKDVCRPGDLVARTGGEEFVVVAACAEDEQAAIRQGAAIAERLRLALDLRQKEDATLGCTASIGVAGPSVTSFDVTLAQADRALYRAKQAGRNRVVVAGRPPTQRPPEPSSSAAPRAGDVEDGQDAAVAEREHTTVRSRA